MESSRKHFLQIFDTLSDLRSKGHRVVERPVVHLRGGGRRGAASGQDIGLRLRLLPRPGARSAWLGFCLNLEERNDQACRDGAEWLPAGRQAYLLGALDIDFRVRLDLFEEVVDAGECRDPEAVLAINAAERIK